MSDRHDRICDAAITVLGDGGLRRLTHRAVDTAAALPAGSTSNVFRTREALVDGVVGRVLDLETRAWEAMAGTAPPAAPADPAALTALLGRMVRHLADEGRALTIARHAIFHEAVFHPAAQERLRRGRDELARWGVPYVAAAGSPRPETDYRSLLCLVDGLLGNQLAMPEDDFAPEPAIAALIAGFRAG